MTTIILAAQTAAQGGGGMGFLIMMIALFAIMWFFMIRPQQKRQKQIQAFQNAIQVGTSVIIGSGIYGTVKSVDHASGKVEVEIAHGVVVTVDKNAVFQAGAPQQ